MRYSKGFSEADWDRALKAIKAADKRIQREKAILATLPKVTCPCCGHHFKRTVNNSSAVSVRVGIGKRVQEP